MFMLFHKYGKLFSLILVLVLDGLFFSFTNPNRINQIFLLISFILVGLSLFFIFYNIGSYLNLVGFKIKHVFKASLIISIILVLSLALKSIGQFSLIDFVTLLTFSIVLYIYLILIRPPKNIRNK